MSGLVGVQLVPGMLAGFLEGWRMSDAAYFTFVTGLPIGYEDLVPVRFVTAPDYWGDWVQWSPSDRPGRGSPRPRFQEATAQR
jgi:hypothetical protein